MQYLFSLKTDAWTLGYEYLEFNHDFFEQKCTVTSNRILQALEVTNTEDLYQFVHVDGLIKDKRLVWALNAYEDYIESLNEELEFENKQKQKEFNYNLF